MLSIITITVVTLVHFTKYLLNIHIKNYEGSKYVLICLIDIKVMSIFIK
jgi:hypothetical protein